MSLKKGLGDVHLAWENEAHFEVKQSEKPLEIVYPKRPGDTLPLSVLVVPPLAIVDANVGRNGTRVASEAYLNSLYTNYTQELIAQNFLRPIDETVLARHRDVLQDGDFRRGNSLVPSGQWEDVQKTFFAEGGEFDRIYDRTLEPATPGLWAWLVLALGTAALAGAGYFAWQRLSSYPVREVGVQ